MRRSRLLALLSPVLLITALAPAQPQDSSSIAGVYVNQTNPDRWIFLLADHTFLFQDGDTGAKGDYEFDGIALKLKSLNWRATLDGIVLRDNAGGVWTKQPAKSAQARTLKIKLARPRSRAPLPLVPQDTPLRIVPRNCVPLSIANPCTPS